MLTLDTQGQERWRLNENKESFHERRLRELAHEIESNTISVAADDGKFDVSNILQQMGKPMAAEEVQRKLKLCNSRLHFIRSPQFPELTGVYLVLDEYECTGIGELKKKLKHICGMESGIMPEFSVLHKTKKKVPNRELFGGIKPQDKVDWVEVETFAGETRGWRTVLVRLLHAGLITRHDVETHFGWNPSRESKKWYDQTK